MKTLSLDASTSNVGYCVSDENGYIKSGQYQPQGNDAFERTRDYLTWLKGCIEVENVRRVFYERPSGNRGNMMTNLILGGVRFATWFICDALDCQFYELSPKEVKTTGIYKVHSKGKIDQYRLIDISRYKVFDIFTKSDGTLNQSAMDRQDDEIDSIGIMLAGMEKYG